MRYITSSTMIIISLLGVISCGTLNAVERLSLSDVARTGEAVVVLKADGSTRLYGVDENIRLIPSEKCQVGNLPKEAYDKIPGLEKVEPPSRQRTVDNKKICAGAAPNKVWFKDNYSSSVVKVIPDPQRCWFCFLDCSSGNECDQVCIPTPCK